MNNQPPKIPLHFLRWFCRSELLRYIEGDLIELFEENVEQKSLISARLLFVWEVVKLFRPGVIRKPGGGFKTSWGMVLHSVKASLRHFTRHRLIGSINLFGLAIGMTSCMLILLWVTHESSFDTFHKDSDKIYRISCNSGDFHTAVSPGAVAGAISSEYPFVQMTTRLRGSYDQILVVGDHQYKESKVFTAEENFFEFFTYDLIHGVAQTALDDPRDLVISESLARKYFDRTDVIGELVQIDESEFSISGVLSDPPENSHLQFDVLVPMLHSQAAAEYDYDSSWSEFAFRTYMKVSGEPLTANTIDSLKVELAALYLSHEPDFKAGFNIEPIQAIHLENDLQFDTDSGGSILYVSVLSAIAFLILLIACINYANLSSAQAFIRFKELCVRRTIGATRAQLILYFLIEALMYAGGAFIISVGLLYLTLPFFNRLVDVPLNLEVLDRSGVVWALSFVFIVGLLSGVYPSLILSNFSRTSSKSTLQGGHSFFNFRSVLVTIQFIIFISLLSADLILSDQLHMIRNRNLGFDKDNLVYVRLSEKIKSTGSINGELGRLLSEGRYTFTSDVPIDMGQASHGLDWEGKDPGLQAVIPNMGVDHRFLKVFKTEMVSGRFFSKDLKTDQRHYVINQSAAQLMGYTSETAIGKWLDLHGKGNIIGVVEDFNFKSLHLKVEPLVLTYYPVSNYLVIRPGQDQLNETMSEVQNLLATIDPNMYFAFGFVDQGLEQLYHAENRMNRIFRLFALLSIVISSLGLVGLTSYIVNTRIKEVGIRKVLGASRLAIVQLLSRHFYLLLVIAWILSCPITFYVMSQWLDGFAYRISISVGHFAIAILCALLILGVTISFQLVKAASSNPTQLLRDE